MKTSDSRADWSTIFMSVFAFLLPWLGFFAPRFAATLVPIFAIFLISVVLVRQKSITVLRSWGWVVLAGFLSFSALSLWWSVNPDVSGERLVKLSVFLVLGVGLVLAAFDRIKTEDDGRLLSWALIAGFVVGLLFLMVHLLTDGGIIRMLKPDVDPMKAIHGANRPIVMLLLSLSIGMLATRRLGYTYLRWPALAVVAVAFSFSTSQTAAFGLVVWLFVFVIATILPKLTFWAMGIGGCLLILLHPMLVLLVEHMDTSRALDFAPGSVGARLDIWYAVTHKILEAPLLGHGLEAARSITDWSVEFVYYQGRSIHHPHNGILQIWLEFGALGAIAAAVGWAVAVRSMTMFQAPDRPAMLAALAVFLFVTNASHGLWQSWWINAVIGVVGLTVLLAQFADGTSNSVDAKGSAAKM